MSRQEHQLEAAEARLSAVEGKARAALEVYESAKAELETAVEEYIRQQVLLDRARRRVAECRILCQTSC